MKDTDAITTREKNTAEERAERSVFYDMLEGREKKSYEF